MPIDTPPFDVPPGYERQVSGLIAKTSKAVLPGMFPAISAVAASGPATWSVQAVSTFNGVSSIDLSTYSPQSGDLFIIMNKDHSGFYTSPPLPTTVVPSGFTTLRNIAGVYELYNNGVSLRSIISAKKATGLEGSVSVMSSSICIVYLFRPNFSWTSWTDNNTSNNTIDVDTGDSIGTHTITVGSATSTAICYGTWNWRASANEPTGSSSGGLASTYVNGIKGFHAILNEGESLSNQTINLSSATETPRIQQSGWLSITPN